MNSYLMSPADFSASRRILHPARLPLQPDPMSNSRRPSSKSALARGKACLTCRRRKMRCDGVRPACTQCKNGHRELECVFDEGRTKSRTQLLMENVSRLEQRLHHLRKSPSTSSRQHLADDFALGSSLTGLNIFDPGLPLYPTGTAGSSMISDPTYLTQLSMLDKSMFFDQRGAWFADNTPSHISTGMFTSTSEQSEGVVPGQVRTVLLQTFLSHQHLFGLDITNEILSELDQRDMSLCNRLRLKSPLEHAVLLWGCRLQNASCYKQYQDCLLVKALEDITEALAEQDLAINVLQASALMSTYFYSCGRLLEGKYHADAAAALAMALDMHRLNPQEGLSPSSDDTTCSQSASTPSYDKLRVFWSVFELGCWTVATGSHAPLSLNQDPRASIRTPWPKNAPEDSHAYDLDYPVVESLLRTDFPMNPQEDVLSLRAKAAALLQLSTKLSAAIADADGEVDPTVWENFRLLELCINKCSASLGPLPYSPILLLTVDPPQEFFHLILVHTFLSVAMILLHHPLARSNPPSQDKCQTWARKILYTVEQVPAAHFGSMHPIVAMCWAVAADVILQEIIGEKRMVTPSSRIFSLEGELDSLLSAMFELSKIHPIAEILSNRITPKYADVKGVL